MHLVENLNLEIYRALGREVFNKSGCLFVDNELPTSLLNGVIGGTIENREVIDQIIAYFREKERPHCWIIEISKEPKFLEGALKEHGLKQLGEFPGMVIDLAQIKKTDKPEELILKNVTNDEEMKAWSEVIEQAFELSEEAASGYVKLLKRGGYNGTFTHLSGIKEGKVIATGSVLCTENGAYIYNIGTRKDERRKGYGQAVTFALLEKAKKEGHTHATLMSTPMAAPMYRELGFDELCLFHIYA